MKIKAKSKLLLIGDSITDHGRKKPIGEGFKGELGSGYVSLVEALLSSTYTDHHIRVVNMGINGNTCLDLLERWQEDVIEQKPDWVSILIGVNDVWRKLDSPQTENHIPIETYIATLEKLVEDLKKSGTQVILMTPFFVESQKEDLMRTMIDQYGSAVKEVAKKYDTLLVDLQAAFDKFLENNYSAVITKDRVHPNIVGHMIIAKAFLNAIDYEW